MNQGPTLQAGLLYLMAAHFEGLSIYKPAQSRPANSERYVVCRGLRVSRHPALFDHLLAVNDRINQLRPSWGSAAGLQTSPALAPDFAWPQG